MNRLRGSIEGKTMLLFVNVSYEHLDEFHVSLMYKNKQDCMNHFNEKRI
jgi:hypothetical protein